MNSSSISCRAPFANAPGRAWLGVVEMIHPPQAMIGRKHRQYEHLYLGNAFLLSLMHEE